jgi:hypothetical protein
MKSTFTVVLLALILTGCFDSRDNSPVATENKFSKSVGEQISLAVAERWIGLYNQSSAGAKTEDISYSITPDHLKAIANYATEAGIAFHHAIDDVGVHHILIIPVKESTLLTEAPVLIDANADEVLESNTAKTWISNYANAHPEQGWYHFFGYDIFDEIMKSSFSRIDIEPAINDKGEPQLLLVVWSQAAANGKTAASSPTVYDASNLCPPCSN